MSTYRTNQTVVSQYTSGD